VAEDRRGLIVIDTRAAAARARRDQWTRAFAAGGLPTQALLVSQVIRLPLDLHAVFEDNAGSLKRFGFDAEPFGDGDVSLKSLPADLEAARAEDGLRAVLRALAARADEATTLEALAAVAPPAALSPSEALTLFTGDETTGHRMDFATLCSEMKETT